MSCVICNLEAKVVCGHCRQIAYCGQAHANQHWDIHSVDEKYKIKKDDGELAEWQGVRLLKRTDGIAFYLFDMISMSPSHVTELREAIDFSVSGKDMCNGIFPEYYQETMANPHMRYVCAAIVNVVPSVHALKNNGFFSTHGLLSFALVREEIADNFRIVDLICSKKNLYYMQEKKSFVRMLDEDEVVPVSMEMVIISPKLGGQIMYLIAINMQDMPLALHAAFPELITFYRKLGYGLDRIGDDDATVEQVVQDDILYQQIYDRINKNRRNQKESKELDAKQIEDSVRELSRKTGATYKKGRLFYMVLLPNGIQKNFEYLARMGDLRPPKAFWKSYLFRGNEK